MADELKKIKCAGCGKENEVKAKPEPVNGREANQNYFICLHCNAYNLRNGTARYRRGQQPATESKQQPAQPPEQINKGGNDEQETETKDNASGFGFF